MSGVTTTNPQYDDYKYLWWWMRHAVSGDVKGERQSGRSVSGAPGVVVTNGYDEKYSRTYNVREAFLPSEFAVTDPERYLGYLRRAYYFNATGQARKALVGMVFTKDPIKDVPESMDYLLDNFDGSGQSVMQVAKRCEREILTVGRVGLFVDYPKTEPGLSKDEELAIGVRPIGCIYEAESIINWKTTVSNGRSVLSLVVLHEQVDAGDEFGHSLEDQYRVLRLRNGVYSQEVLNASGDTVAPEFEPLAAGAALDHIPFYFIGAEDNMPDVDEPVLKALADTNVAHYQVTADNMENLHVHGQVTLGVVTKLDYSQFKDANPNGIKVGARTGHYLGEGGQLVTATAPESSSLSKALTQIEQQMIYLGGKLVTRGGQAQTAEAARIEAAAEYSVLDTTVKNLSEAFEAALKDMARFEGANPDDVSFAFDMDYMGGNVDPQLAAAITGLKQGEIISMEEAVDMIKSGKIQIPEGRTADEIKQAIAGDLINNFEE